MFMLNLYIVFFVSYKLICCDIPKIMNLYIVIQNTKLHLTGPWYMFAEVFLSLGLNPNCIKKKYVN